ncbi:TadE/TadG family type IV pilus assembly protein [Mesorhizobium sp. B1-1-8]|uniref:TadE/TadG family type IV pilus assembly protein n=1 Tax=Mesorhizobium sp. B1-1-8 TaxID=2589976 RepID=UPI00112BBF9C|nr:TadE/TadG family type IV pilus assembly protein [Mesorhizobium sp. B1-1-8]UCI06147.1 pilus assembly protein [Mesorhizobium sp. B1-1-8]
MIRRFLRDRRGNYALVTAITMVPLMAAVGLAVDYAELVRQKQETLNALDAAGIATAQQIVTGASDDAAKAYAKNFFEANLRHVLPANTALTVTLPNNNTGGGTLKMQATLTYHPYFMPAAVMLLGGSMGNTKVDIVAKSEVRLKNTLEVALVLDNSGSMGINGSGTGQPRIELLKTAATELVDTLAKQADQMKQISKPVQFSLVPFSASVNVGPANNDKAWMDLDGISPIHHEDFDWSTMYKSAPGADPNKYIEKVGDAYWKRGSGWGAGQNTTMTRFKLYQDMMATTRTCTKKRSNGSCQTYSTPTTGQYEAWKGCVEARPYPYNVDDTTPTTSKPASLFVPMFAPDEAGNLWTDSTHTSTASWGYSNNWWVDSADSLAVAKRQSDMRKYFITKPYTAPAEPTDGGPNAGCTTSAITPLQDITTTAGKTTLTNAINAMTPTGNTNVPEGLAWGWRTLSSNEPFAEGRDNNEKGNDKVVIVLTDGANTYSAFNDGNYAKNRSTYAAYGYTGLTYPGSGTVTRLFMNTSAAVGKTNYTDSNYTAALDEQMQALCANAKAAGIMVMTVSLDLVDTKADEKKAMAALKACASDSRFRKDPTDASKAAKLYWNATGATLSDDFKEIANELSNLRIVS